MPIRTPIRPCPSTRPLLRLSSRLGCLRFLALCSVVRNSLSTRNLGYRSSKLRREIAKIMLGTFSIQVDQPSASAISGRIQSRCGLEADQSRKWSGRQDLNHIPKNPRSRFLPPFESIYTPRNTPKYQGTIIPARARSCPASSASRITRLISPW